MLKRLDVLIVDDCDADAFAASACLDSCPYVDDHLRANDGEMATDILAREVFSPDLILLDLNMPHVDGFEFITRYRELKPRNPATIAVLSTSGRGTDFHKAVVRRAAIFIVKPSRLSNLRRELHELCHAVAHGTAPKHKLVRAA